MIPLLTRRQALTASGTGLVTTSLAGCELFSTDPVTDQNSEPQDKGKEAPDLAKQVSDGTLPSVEKRLPAEPLVVEPTDRVGRYGGTWLGAIHGAGDYGRLERTVSYECLLRWAPDGWEPQPNVAKSWEIDRAGRVFTFHLRKGMRWSDGEPFTADDLVFAYEDVLNNTDITPVPIDYFVRGGKPGKLEKLDDQTVRFTFAEPHSLFPEFLSYHPQVGRILCNRPRHYLEQFHPSYADNVDKLAKDVGFPNWIEFFLSKSAEGWENKEIPTICAWKFVSELGTGGDIRCERNPYYWKTDPDGSQLPYIDKVRFSIVENEESLLLKTANGEVAFEAFSVNTVENKAVLAKHSEDSDYGFSDLTNAIMNYGVIALNMTHKDAGLRAMFREKDFRIGLSYAINRQELVDAPLHGQARPWQAAPNEDSQYYDKALATQYTDYDVDLANEHLDKAGLDRRDSEGWRLRSDGMRAAFTVDLATPSPYPSMVGIMELVVRHWKAVGIDARVKPIDRSFFVERRDANQHEANVWPGGGGLDDALLDPYWYFPIQTGSSYAVPWATWYRSGGAEGEEPPDAPKRQMQLYDEVRRTIDKGRRTELLREILAIAREEFYAIGTVGPTVGYAVVRNDFHNVPGRMIAAATFYTPGPTNPEQYFIEAE